MIPTISECVLILATVALLFLYQSEDAQGWLAARLLTRRECLRAVKAERIRQLARWNKALGIVQDEDVDEMSIVGRRA